MHEIKLSTKFGYIGYLFTATTALSFAALPLFIFGLIICLTTKEDFKCSDFYLNLSGIFCSLFFIMYLIAMGIIALN